MGVNSNIEWTNHTFNPWWGCAKVSPGCDHCYAEALGNRFGTPWGVDAERREFGEKHWDEPRKWNAKAAAAGERHRVFCASMADVFDKNAPLGARERLWKLIDETPNLDWLLLTKRIGNAQEFLPARWAGELPRNIWLGISVVNQQEADRDIPKLLAIEPARVKFLSMEPLLGPVDLKKIPIPNSGSGDHEFDPIITMNVLKRASFLAPHIHWVIVGGESGPHARPMHPDWARSLRDQCASAGVPFLFKQWGEWLPDNQNPAVSAPHDPNGAIRVGKKAAGRELDGRTHDEFPNA
jgi:protein gp37